MDFLLGRRGGAQEAASGSSGAATAPLPPIAVRAEQQAVLDSPTATAEERLTAALAAIAHLTEAAADRTRQLEQSRATSERLSAEVASLTQKASEAAAALERARRSHQAELDALEDRYGDEEERDRYTKDLEKELTQWRKLGSQGQGQQTLIAPVQSVALGQNADGSTAAAVGQTEGGGADAESGPADGGSADADVSSDDAAAAVAAHSSSASAAAAVPDDHPLRRALQAAEAALAEAKANHSLAEQRSAAAVADLKAEVARLKTDAAAAAEAMHRLEQRCEALDSESGVRDDNLSALYDESRSLREAAAHAELMARAAEEREARGRERTIAAESLLADVRADLAEEEGRHQQCQRQLATALRDVQQKADAVKALKLEMTRAVAQRGSAAGGGAGKAAATTSSSLADAEEGRATGGSPSDADASVANAAAAATSSSGASSGNRGGLAEGQAFSADGGVIHVDLTALYAKVASADAWRRAWEKLRDRQQHVRSLGRTQRFAVAGVVLFALWICYVLMSAIILVDGDGEDELRAVARRLLVCESLVQSLKHKNEELGAALLSSVAAAGASLSAAAVGETVDATAVAVAVAEAAATVGVDAIAAVAVGAAGV